MAFPTMLSMHGPVVAAWVGEGRCGYCGETWKDKRVDTQVCRTT